MNSTRPSSVHPSEEVLALFARTDLSWIQGLRVGGHLRRCAECQQQMLSLRSAVTELQREAAAETLTAFEAVADWKTLEREMIGNIVVGVAASRCIERVGRRQSWLPRVVVAVGLGALFVGGWITHMPGQQTRQLADSLRRLTAFRRVPRPANVVETTANGIAVRSDGVTLTILHPPSARVSLSGNSAVQARYIDEDTGQLTITNVYGQ